MYGVARAENGTEVAPMCTKRVCGTENFVERQEVAEAISTNLATNVPA